MGMCLTSVPPRPSPAPGVPATRGCRTPSTPPGTGWPSRTSGDGVVTSNVAASRAASRTSLRPARVAMLRRSTLRHMSNFSAGTSVTATSASDAEGCTPACPQRRAIHDGQSPHRLDHARSETIQPAAHPQAPGLSRHHCVVEALALPVPQHGPGRKHERPIVLEAWQRAIVDQHPAELLRGLLHSDGSRVANWTSRVVAGERRRYDYPRWRFTNNSDDIRELLLVGRSECAERVPGKAEEGRRPGFGRRPTRTQPGARYALSERR
ncbi:MAG: hypothetical protein JWN22_2055 [Nocardioides sp.]|jgi:hypothetical protein|nr:hypothetical protein [Nocardioides sp.]